MSVEKIVVTNNQGQELEVTRGGDILTGIIIFDRPDLFEKCPPEIQRALKLYQVAMNLSSQADYQGSRRLMEEAFGSLSIEEIK